MPSGRRRGPASNVRVASIGPKKSARLVSFLAGSGFPIQSTKRAAILRGSPSGLKISHLPQEAPFLASDFGLMCSMGSNELRASDSVKVKCSLFVPGGWQREPDPRLGSLLALGFGDLRYRDEAAALSSLSVRVLGYSDLLEERGRPTASARREFSLGLRPARSGKSYLFCSLDELSNPGS